MNEPIEESMTRHHESPDLRINADQSSEAKVLECARRYAVASQKAGWLERDRVLAREEERLAECDYHRASNDRLMDNLVADDRTMGFTGTTGVASGDDPVDRETGAAWHGFQVLVEARSRLDVLCEQANRRVQEAHEALMSATAALVVDSEEGEREDGRDEGFDLLVGGGTQAVPPVEVGAEGVTSAA
ncbi:MAG: hypothetical protein VX897_00840 [Actinomycetota bacterium]|nr:hypothetical protein [Actinomycetota bacterium]